MKLINKFKNSAKYLFINYFYKLSGTQIKQKEMTLPYTSKCTLLCCDVVMNGTIITLRSTLPAPHSF